METSKVCGVCYTGIMCFQFSWASMIQVYTTSALISRHRACSFLINDNLVSLVCLNIFHGVNTSLWSNWWGVRCERECAWNCITDVVVVMRGSIFHCQKFGARRKTKAKIPFHLSIGFCPGPSGGGRPKLLQQCWCFWRPCPCRSGSIPTSLCFCCPFLRFISSTSYLASASTVPSYATAAAVSYSYDDEDEDLMPWERDGWVPSRKVGSNIPRTKFAVSSLGLWRRPKLSKRWE